METPVQIDMLEQAGDIEVLHSTERGKQILEFDNELMPATHKALMSRLVPGKGSQVMVLPEDIRILPGFNPRIQTAKYEAHVEQITQSILAEGYYQDKPLAGFAGMDGKRPVLYLTEGETRYRAAKRAIERGADLEYLPLVIKPEGTNIEDLTTALVRSNTALGFAPLELAILCARMSKFGRDPKHIGEKFGIDPNYVKQLLILAASPPSVRNMVEEGKTTAGVAVQAIRDHGSDAAKVLDEAYVKAQDDAKAKGKGVAKVTRKMLPSSTRRKFFVQQAPSMFQSLQKVQVHSAFTQLPGDLQALINDILSKASELEPEGKEEAGEGEAPTAGTNTKAEGTQDAA